MSEAQTYITLDAKPDKIVDYSKMLDKFGTIYTEVEQYLHINNTSQSKGWIIHVSIIAPQFLEAFQFLHNILHNHNVCYRIPINSDVLKLIQNGNLGLQELGKVITIYPEKESTILRLTQELIQSTKRYKGPDVLTDRHLGGQVYVRFGNYKKIKTYNDHDNIERTCYQDMPDTEDTKYHIPFKLTQNQVWPFESVEDTSKETRQAVGNIKMIQILKEDARGNVTKGLWSSSWWKVKTCVIKTGKYGMMADDYGRDITDRLDWQFELHQRLDGKVPIPKIYQYIKLRDHHLIFEHIEGKRLDDYIKDLFNDRIWNDLTEQEKKTMLRYSLRLVGIIKQLHNELIVHRDINPGNFLINKTGDLILIDLELAYCLTTQKPYPPFRYGTAWFMSQEQQNVEAPTVYEDIYAVAASILVMLTGSLPSKFCTENPSICFNQIKYFLDDSKLSRDLTDCFSADKSKRPTLDSVGNSIKEMLNKNFSQKKGGIQRQEIKFIREKLGDVIASYLMSLRTSKFMSANKLWFSKTQQDHQYSYYQMDQCSIYPGLTIGVGGILCLLSSIKAVGYNIDHLKPVVEANFKYLKSVDVNHSMIGYGLYSGSAGLVQTLMSAIKTGLQPTEDIHDLLVKYLSGNQLKDNTFSQGLAGRIFAILSSINYLEPNVYDGMISQYVEELLAKQEHDGSWINYGALKSDKVFGLKNGVSGIIFSLLKYYNLSNDTTVLPNIENGLSWLIKISKKSGGKRWWPYSNKIKKQYYSFDDGIAGIALCFLQAAKILNIPSYAEIAKSVLLNIPDNMFLRDFTLANGLTGIGEVYLEASKVLDEQFWLQRALKIAEFFLNQYKITNEGSIYWLTDHTPFSTADLSTGNSGVVYFLLRCYNRDTVTHPLMHN